jgi:hypothetical protein
MKKTFWFVSAALLLLAVSGLTGCIHADIGNLR